MSQSVSKSCDWISFQNWILDPEIDSTQRAQQNGHLIDQKRQQKYHQKLFFQKSVDFEKFKFCRIVSDFYADDPSHCMIFYTFWYSFWEWFYLMGLQWCQEIAWNFVGVFLSTQGACLHSFSRFIELYMTMVSQWGSKTIKHNLYTGALIWSYSALNIPKILSKWEMFDVDRIFQK